MSLTVGDVVEKQARAEMAEVCALAYNRGYICGTEGNFSIRLTSEVVLTTPAGTCKGRVKPDDLVLTDLEGNPLRGGRPSTELKMHLTAYKIRPDIKAVVHAHPTVAVGFSVAGKPLSQCVLPEVVCSLGAIPTAPYATPSTGELSVSIEELARDHDALVLDHHGALTFGESIWDAYYKLETLEHFAQTLLVANVLGGPKLLTKSQVEKLLAICSAYGLKKPPFWQDLLTAKHCSDDAE